MNICSRWSAISSQLVQDFETKLKHHFIRAEEWPLSSLDVNLLDYFYWEFAKTKVYEGKSGKLFASEAELKNKIKSYANDLVPIRKAIKQSVPQMKAAEETQEGCIKMLFGKCFYIRIAFYMCFSGFLQKFIQYCSSFKR